MKTWILLCTLVFAASRPTLDQAGSIAGRVTDQTGAVLPGVIVDLTTARGERTTTTDGGGAFRFDRVDPGAAELTYRLINFTLPRRSVLVAEGQTTQARGPRGESQRRTVGPPR